MDNNNQTTKSADQAETGNRGNGNAEDQARLSNQVQDYAKHAHNPKHDCRKEAPGSGREEKRAEGAPGAKRSEMILRKEKGFPPNVELVGHKGKPEGCATVPEGRPKHIPGTDLTVQRSVTVCER